MTATITAELIATLAAGTSGVIQLPAGTFSGLKLMYLDAKVTIKGAPGYATKFTDLDVIGCAGLTFSGIEFDASTTPMDPTYGWTATNAFKVGYQSSDIHFVDCKVHGNPAWTLGQAVCGFLVRDSQNISFTRCEFHHLHLAVGHLNINGLTATNNHFHHLFDDSLRGGGSNNVNYSGNLFRDNHPDPLDTDHPDAMQFWTAGTLVNEHDFIIHDNCYFRGAGGPTQGVFFGNELMHQYINITITNNLLLGPLWNGITVKNAKNVLIDGNTVLTDPRIPVFPNVTPQLIVARIGTDGCIGLTLTNNTAGDIIDAYWKTPSTFVANTGNTPKVPPYALADAETMLAAWIAKHPAVPNPSGAS